jgi:hypothetical protein
MALRQQQPSPFAPLFERQKQEVQQRGAAAQQRAQEAIARRFAAAGRGPSGAAIKAEQLARQDIRAQTEQALGGIEAREMAQQAQLEEVARGREFAAGEAEKARGFQERVGREQREAQQAFAAEQSRLAREQQAGQFAAQFGLQREASRRAEQQLNLAQEEFALNERTLAFNKAISAVEAGDMNAINQWDAYFRGAGPRPQPAGDTEKGGVIGGVAGAALGPLGIFLGSEVGKDIAD